MTSILSKQTVYKTNPAQVNPRVGWNVDWFEELIQSQGYDAYIDRAMRCPCVEKATGQALSTCHNCGGRGWFFTDRTQTRLIAQHMDSKKQYLEWSEVNRGTASFTTRGIDKMGFMDRIILIQLEEFYSEILRPIQYDKRTIAYPVYEPLKITDMFLYTGDNSKLVTLRDSAFTISGNQIIFNIDFSQYVSATDPNSNELPISISVRYSHYPVYHVVDINRELMKVREGKLCSFSDNELRQMPINVQARKAHYIFDAQRFGNSIFDNVPNPIRERW